MPTTNSMIRLVGGPRILDGSTHDLSPAGPDRAGATGDRFIRAVRGSTTTGLADLQRRCSDRAMAEQLAGEWTAAVFVPGRARRVRARIFRFEGTYQLEPQRDSHGEWTLHVGARRAGSVPPPAHPAESGWTVLERAVDASADRFSRVAGLLPVGPLAERAAATRRAVGACVADAARLCGVGMAVAPDWHPLPGSMIPTGRCESLARQVVTLVGTIDEATNHLVDLHLEIGDALDPVEPVAHLAHAWVELGIV